MSRFALDQAWEADGDSGGFYTLTGGSNWAFVEGFASEWLAIAVAIRERKYQSFSRCAFRPSPNGGGGELWSPRNACSPRDRANVAESELAELADMIVATLRAAGEVCVVKLDPVPTGAFI